MKKIKVFIACIKQSLIYEMQYKASFIFNCFTSIGWTYLSFLTVTLVGSNMPSIYTNWTKNQYLLFWVLNFISEGVVSTIFKRNYEKIPDKIVNGELDYILTRPFKSKLLATLGQIRFDTLPGFFFINFIAFRSVLNLESSNALFTNILLFISFLILLPVIRYSLVTATISLCFWLLGASNIMFLTHQIISFAHYPINAFGKAFSFIFTFIFPIAFISFFPAKILFDFSITHFLILIFVAIILYKISDFIWNLGLKNYSSASS